VVPTAVDLSRFSLSLHFPQLKTALFSGTYNDYYDLDLSADFIQEVRKKIHIDVHWARPIESNKTKIGVGESKIIPSIQLEMSSLIPNYSFGMSVCRLDSGQSLTAAMPTKIAEFLACGRPVVVNKGLGDMDAFIDEFDAGVILDGTPTNLVESVEKLISLIADPDTPKRCRALTEKYFSMDSGSEKYIDLYSRMLKVES